MNSVNLIGRLGGDPELRYSPGGVAVCSFSIAIDRQSKDRKTDWFHVKAFQRTAEVVNEFCRKGSQIGIKGHLQLDTWEHEGQKRSKVLVIADQIDLLGSSSKNENSSSGSKKNGAEGWGSDSGFDSDEIPF